jgi:hypothetical protein
MVQHFSISGFFFTILQTNRFSKNTLVGYCEVDLFDLLTKVTLILLLSRFCSCLISPYFRFNNTYFMKRLIILFKTRESGTAQCCWFNNSNMYMYNSISTSYLRNLLIYAETLYSLRPILLFANTDVSITKMCLDTSILAKSNMDRRE